MRPFFLNSVAEKIILNISDRNDYILRITKVINVGYSHVIKIINILEEKNMVTREKIGRKIKIKLTSKGKSIQSHLKEIRKLL